MLKRIGFDDYNEYIVNEVNSLNISAKEKAEILEELNSPMISPEYIDELKAEYEKLTGKPVPNPISGDWEVGMGGITPPEPVKPDTPVIQDPEVKPETPAKPAETPKPAPAPKANDRAAEILEELNSPMISLEYADELKAEYEKLTGKPVPGEEPNPWSIGFNPFGQ